jgi:predicted RecB family endonuclease
VRERGRTVTNERWLKWAIARYYRSHGYKVTMKPARAGNAMVDGVAVSPDGERIAIEVKSPRDDIIRGVGQCYEAICAGYNRAVLVTTLRVARRLKKQAFQRRGIRLVGVDAKAASRMGLGFPASALMLALFL